MLQWNHGYWNFVQVFVFFSHPAENATDFLHLFSLRCRHSGGAFSDICLAESRPLKKRREETLSVWKSLIGGIMPHCGIATVLPVCC